MRMYLKNFHHRTSRIFITYLISPPIKLSLYYLENVPILLTVKIAKCSLR